MKNTYAKETHFSKCKSRQLLKMFCSDFTALQIASLNHLNRNTVNMWIKRISARILLMVEQEKMTNATTVQLDETY